MTQSAVGVLCVSAPHQAQSTSHAQPASFRPVAGCQSAAANLKDASCLPHMWPRESQTARLQAAAGRESPPVGSIAQLPKGAVQEASKHGHRQAEGAEPEGRGHGAEGAGPAVVVTVPAVWSCPQYRRAEG